MRNTLPLGRADNSRRAWARAGVLIFGFLFLAAWPPRVHSDQGATLGDFEAHADVGETPKKGAAEYDAARQEYRVTGGGANMWASVDAFHFVWRRMSGDLTLSADVELVGDGGQPHRKAGWVVRQTLEANSPYVSAVVHGDGLTTMQYREQKGALTQEVRSSINMPRTLVLRRRGNVFSFAAAKQGEVPKEEVPINLDLTDPVYVGLAVCAHDAGALETALFSRVRIEGPATARPPEPAVESSLDIISVDGRERKSLYRALGRFEAPNWSRDGEYLLFNSDGKLYTLPVSGGVPTLLDTGTATRCNNDHGFSPDGKLIALSHSPGEHSLIYIMPSGGGEPRLITPKGPSYWHGWSPDGKTLAYCAERHGNFDIYTIPVKGGEEQRLTDAPGLDDGPDYSPDGQWIYFNSERTGRMQIWRMRPDGTSQEQVTRDNYNNWFPHPSPDGKWLVFLSYEESVKGHPPNQNVALRLMPLAGDKPRVLVKLFGGQGTINVPSWSPDGRRLAFVSYRLLGR